MLSLPQPQHSVFHKMTQRTCTLLSQTHRLPREQNFLFVGSTVAKLSKFSFETYIDKVVRMPANEHWGFLRSQYVHTTTNFFRVLLSCGGAYKWYHRNLFEGGVFMSQILINSFAESKACPCLVSAAHIVELRDVSAIYPRPSPASAWVLSVSPPPAGVAWQQLAGGRRHTQPNAEFSVLGLIFNGMQVRLVVI